MEEKVFIKNRRGLKLASIINLPDKKSIYPAVIILHGFTGYKEEKHLEELAKTLSQNKFVGIRFDASGCGESDGNFENDYLTSHYAEDVDCVYEYLKTLSFVDKEKIGVVGHSMGGGLAIIFASMHPKMKFCIAISATTSMRNAQWTTEIIEEWKKTGWFDKEYSRDGKLIKIPYSFLIDSDKYDTLRYVKSLNCPLMIIVGTADSVVAPNDTKKIYDLAKESKKLVEINGMGHDYKKYNNYIIIVNDKIRDFIDKSL